MTVVEAPDRLLSMEEPESGELAAEALERDGVTFHTGVHAKQVGYDGDAFTVTLADGAAVTGEKLLVATGRRARPDELGLDTVGLDPRPRSIEVDEHVRAGDGVWAVGDVTGVRRVHPHRDVPGGHRGPRHPRRRTAPPAELPRACPGSPSPTRRSARSG